MAQQDIKVTVVGDTLPVGGAKINANFAEVRAELLIAEASATTASNVAAQASADAAAATSAVATATSDAAAAVAAVAAATAASDAAVAAVTAATANNAVTDAKLRDSAAVSVIGRAANSTGDPADIVAGSNDTLLARVSNAVAFQQLTAGMVPNDLITYAKLQNVSATSRILGRLTSGAGDAEELTGTQLTTLLDPVTSTLQGLAPPSGGGTSTYLRADGTWSAPTTAPSFAVTAAETTAGVTITDLTKPVYDPRRYGGDATGATDSTVAMQAAANVAYTASGGVSTVQDKGLILPGGAFRIDSTVTIKCNVIGNGTVILLASAAQLIVDRDAVTISGLKIYPSFTGTGTVAAVEIINYRAFVALRDLFISETGSNKFSIGVKANCLSCTFDNVRVSGANTYGIYTYNVTTSNPNANEYTGCRVRNCGTYNFYILNGVSGSFIGCVSEGTTPVGIYLKNTAAVAFTGNHIEATGSGVVGIRIEDSDQCMLTGGFWGPLTAGTNVDLINSDRTTLIGHQYSSSGVGVAIDANCDSTHFIGGYIRASQITNNGTNTRMSQGDGHNSGTALEPSISFAADPDTGFYTTGTGAMKLSLDGGLRYSFNKTGLTAVNLAGEAGGVTITAQEVGTATTARFATTTTNGTWSWGSKIAATSNWNLVAPSTREVCLFSTAAISLGNTTDNQAFNILGSGAISLGTGAITASGASLTLSNAEPRLILSESDQGSDLKGWDFDVNGAVLTGRTRTDADGAGVNWLSVTRGSTTAVSAIALGNATNNPAVSVLGSGAVNLGSGTVTSTGASLTLSNAEPRLILNESDQSTDLKAWDFDVNGGVLTGRTRADADGAGVNWLSVTRGSTTAVSAIALGNATNNPTVSVLGGGAVDLGTGTVAAGAAITVTNAEPRLKLSESDQGSDLKMWDLDVNAGVLTGRTRTDADGAGVNWLSVTRGATTAISNISLGNATNNPTFNYLGSGTFAIAGAATVGTNLTLNGGTFYLNTAAPVMRWVETDQSTDLKRWAFQANGGVLTLSTNTDADGAGKNIFTATRGATTTVSAITIGNSTDNPALTLCGPHTLVGSGATTGAQTATFSATNKPGSATGGPTIWIPVIISGTTYWIPGFAN